MNVETFQPSRTADSDAVMDAVGAAPVAALTARATYIVTPVATTNAMMARSARKSAIAFGFPKFIV